MISRAQGLLSWADRWRTLRAWRRDLSQVRVEVSDQAHPQRLGTCWSLQQRLVIYRGPSFVDELSTLVHELAHAATILEHHSEIWQEVYAAAVTEITGIEVVPVAHDYRVLDRAAEDALRSWWRTSGNDRLWRLAHTGRLA